MSRPLIFFPHCGRKYGLGEQGQDEEYNKMEKIMETSIVLELKQTKQPVASIIEL